MDELMQELERELIEVPEQLPEEKPRSEEFMIDCEERASWLVGRLTALDSKEKLVKDQAKAILKEVENNRRYLKWRFGEQLEIWAHKNLPNGKKTLKLLTGTMAFRTTVARLVVIDEDKAIAWAKKNLVLAVTSKEILHKTVLDTYFKGTGELPDGCDLKEESESFSIK